MAAVRRTLRLTQSVVPFGVGAIYDVFGESFAGCDISMWGGRGRTINSAALKQQLGIAGLKAAPSLDELRYGIPYVRFPRWLFCQRCRTLFEWSRSDELPDEPAICIVCSGTRQLVPMRFVVACRDGHLSDVPWDRWAHSGAKGAVARCQNSVLQFKSRSSGGSGLGSLQVACKKCGTSRSLAGLTAKSSLTRLGIRCRGIQPWQIAASGVRSCDEEPQVVQRGASNVYFADVVSALEIPTAEGLGAFDQLRCDVENHPAFGMLRRFLEQGGVEALKGPMAVGSFEMLFNDLKATEEQVRAILLSDDAKGDDQGDHMQREWLALRTPQPKNMDVRAPFLTRHTSLLTTDDVDPWVQRIVDSVEDVVLVTRLKEIRALRSFSRLDPGNTRIRPDLTPLDGKPNVKWAPAVEVYGEGIFLAFKEGAISAWEERRAVRERAKKMQTNLAHSNLGRSIVKQRLGHELVSPRFVLLHTMAHLLIRELCFECGYSSASLRERIYSRTPVDGSPQAGILVFTAAGDAEGTLGGLVRQGNHPRLIRSIAKALESARWCSADPICRESEGQGYDSTNLAACHACSLLPETSCVTGNMLLDRSLVMSVDTGDAGFFEDVTSRGRESA